MKNGKCYFDQNTENILTTYDWTRQLYDAMLPEAKANNMDVYHLLEIKYNAKILPGPSWQIIRFFDDKLRTMFVLKYGHLI